MSEDYFQVVVYFQDDPPFGEEQSVWRAYTDSNIASRYYLVRTILGRLSDDLRLFRFSN